MVAQNKLNIYSPRLKLYFGMIAMVTIAMSPGKSRLVNLILLCMSRLVRQWVWECFLHFRKIQAMFLKYW